MEILVDNNWEVERNAAEPEPKSAKWEESPASPGLSTVSNASQARYGDPDQTLIFMDWDDTLFPTTELFDRWQVPSKPHLWDEVQLAAEQDAALEVWRAALYEHLCTATSLSKRVVIVTNSHRPWVSECASRFCPNILPLLEDIKVVYAREHMPKKSEVAVCNAERLGEGIARMHCSGSNKCEVCCYEKGDA
jgi:hypothetical protein